MGDALVRLPGWKGGERQEFKNLPRLADEEINIEPGDGKEGKGTRADGRPAPS